jgi:hypothetical protein
MRSVFVTALVAASISFVGAANAEDDCGPGCHNAQNGGCIVDGWEAGARVPNICPVGTKPRRPCPAGYVWKFKACFPS